MKNAFYFTLKAFFVLKISEFCQDFLVMWKKSLIRKIRLISEFITSQSRKETIAIQILPYISKIKGNQTTKFGQLIEYKMRNLFLEKSYKKCCGETIPRPFLKNQNWACLWINSLKFYLVCFYCIVFNLQYCEWNNSALKDCVNSNSPYDTKKT